MKFVSVKNEKATSKFHVPVQTPAFPRLQRSQEDVEMQTAQKACRAGGPTDKNNYFTISEVNSSLQEFASL